VGEVHLDVEYTSYCILVVKGVCACYTVAHAREHGMSVCSWQWRDQRGGQQWQWGLGVGQSPPPQRSTGPHGLVLACALRSTLKSAAVSWNQEAELEHVGDQLSAHHNQLSVQPCLLWTVHSTGSFSVAPLGSLQALSSVPCRHLAQGAVTLPKTACISDCFIHTNEGMNESGILHGTPRACALARTSSHVHCVKSRRYIVRLHVATVLKQHARRVTEIGCGLLCILTLTYHTVAVHLNLFKHYAPSCAPLHLSV
jgi:hypothetical protein